MKKSTGLAVAPFINKKSKVLKAVSLLLSFSAHFTKESSFYLHCANSKVCSAQLEILSAALNSL